MAPYALPCLLDWSRGSSNFGDEKLYIAILQEYSQQLLISVGTVEDTFKREDQAALREEVLRIQGSASCATGISDCPHLGTRQPIRSSAFAFADETWEAMLLSAADDPLLRFRYDVCAYCELVCRSGWVLVLSSCFASSSGYFFYRPQRWVRDVHGRVWVGFRRDWAGGLVGMADFSGSRVLRQPGARQFKLPAWLHARREVQLRLR
ncbi:unnamed protein product, partial [Polarella glacialis]